MPNRLIKESIWTSPNLNNLSAEAERHFWRLLPAPDDHGCFESTPAVIRGKCYPLLPDITDKEINNWQGELEANDLIIRWQNGHREFAIFPTLQKHQTIRSLHKRKTPEPPSEVVAKCTQLYADASNGEQVITPRAHGRDPNPNPNHYHNPVTAKVFTVYDEEIHPIKQSDRDEIVEMIDYYGEDRVLGAIHIAVGKEKRNLPYIKGILKKTGTLQPGREDDGIERIHPHERMSPIFIDPKTGKPEPKVRYGR